MSGYIDLGDQKPLSAGSEREVFLHPEDSGKLIKTLIPAERQQIKNRLRRYSAKLFPSTRLRALHKELEVYKIAITGSQDLSLPIAHMFGFTQTNRGTGCIVERVRGTDQPLGISLRRLAAIGQFNDQRLEMYNNTVRRIDQLNIRVSDLNPRNFVIGFRGDGDEECVLIDGTGDTHAIPIRSLSNYTNRLANSIEYRRHASKLGLRWDSVTYQFIRA